MKKLIALTIASLSLILTGCQHVAGVGATVTNTNGDLGGGVNIVFKDAKGIEKSVPVSRKNSKGYTAEGTRFVTLNELKTYAIYLYSTNGKVPAGFEQLNAFDSQTVAIVVASLASYGAQAGTLK